jgi:predicted GNAT superfamily acetyltransferase
MSTTDFSIRPLITNDEYRVCEDLQYAVWRLEEREILPDHMMLTCSRHGGVVLGAFSPGDEMIGFLFGFPGAGDESFGVEWLHCSHILGVLPAWQGRGVGYRLKLAQREQVMAQGLKLVVWTYDPLESRNAALNIRKLGAINRRYLRNLYGDMRDALNVGLPSDRFEVEWWVDSARVHRRLAEGSPPPARVLDAPSANRVHWRGDGLPVPEDAGAAWDGAPARLEIPADFQRIRSADADLARAWRLHFRAACEAAFAAGYAVTDFASITDEGRRSSHYLLEAPGLLM